MIRKEARTGSMTKSTNVNVPGLETTLPRVTALRESSLYRLAVQMLERLDIYLAETIFTLQPTLSLLQRLVVEPHA